MFLQFLTIFEISLFYACFFWKEKWPERAAFLIWKFPNFKKKIHINNKKFEMSKQPICMCHNSYKREIRKMQIDSEIFFFKNLQY